MTPKLYNRYTINPLAHFDLIGLIGFIFAGFGWAKPVPINPSNFNNYKKGCFFVAIAGVSANLILAFLVFPLFILVRDFVPDFGYFTYVLKLSLWLIYTYSIVFSIFNLIPIYPLDGFKAVDVFTKKQSKFYWFMRTKAIYLLYFLIALSFISNYTSLTCLNIFGKVIDFIAQYVSYPITWFWGLFF